MTAVGDHVRPTTAGHDPGVYRVVGVAADEVVLVRLTDGADRRVSVGELTRVAPAELDTLFAPAGNPDAESRPSRALRSLLVGAYWSVRGRL